MWRKRQDPPTLIMATSNDVTLVIGFCCRYSFGVLLFEIYSFGIFPFDHVTDNDLIALLVDANKSLDRALIHGMWMQCFPIPGKTRAQGILAGKLIESSLPLILLKFLQDSRVDEHRTDVGGCSLSQVSRGHL